MAKAALAIIRVLNNRWCEVRGLDERAEEILDDALAVEQPGARFNPRVRRGLWDGKKHLFRRKTLQFPKGLLTRVRILLAELKYRIKIKDARKNKPGKPTYEAKDDLLKGVTLRDYQVAAVAKALKKCGGIQWLATNAGKTEIICATIKCLWKERALVLVHKTALLQQTRERIAKRFGTIEEHVGIIGAGKFDPKHITVATIQSLTRKMPYQKKKIIKQYLSTIQQLHIDEGHHSKALTWLKLINSIDAPYRFIYSGTPFANGSDDLIVESACGPVLGRITNKQLIKLGVSAVPTIFIVNVDGAELDPTLMWRDVYTQGIISNQRRNELVAKYTVKQAKDGRPTLVLVKELHHGDIITQAVKAHGHHAEFVHGKMSMDQVNRAKHAFEAGKFPVLIASPIFDEGVDVPAIKSLVIADGGKSIRSVLQKIGRGLRKKEGENKLRVVDFADTSHRWLAHHTQERISIYESEGFKIKVVQPKPPKPKKIPKLKHREPRFK